METVYVYVKFANPLYNYTTCVSPGTTDQQLQAYFVGQQFDRSAAGFEIENFQTCIAIEVTRRDKQENSIRASSPIRFG